MEYSVAWRLSTAPYARVGTAATWLTATFILQRNRKFTMEQAQLIQAAASIAGGMAAAHYDRFSGLVASRITEIAETAVKIAKAIEIEARKQPEFCRPSDCVGVRHNANSRPACSASLPQPPPVNLRPLFTHHGRQLE